MSELTITPLTVKFPHRSKRGILLGLTLPQTAALEDHELPINHQVLLQPGGSNHEIWEGAAEIGATAGLEVELAGPDVSNAPVTVGDPAGQRRGRRVRFFLSDEKPQVIASHLRRAGQSRSRWPPRADASVLANSEVPPEETHPARAQRIRCERGSLALLLSQAGTGIRGAHAMGSAVGPRRWLSFGDALVLLGEDLPAMAALDRALGGALNLATGGLRCHFTWSVCGDI
ncbi:hypothetical protein DEJ48_35950 [Streptomyces venezuelae]|uniref:Uncharacterized protein n=1 Tax=Streptomyces venezuelae TaxID=54571 RepID=A0A5P2C5Q3_STRVZ|nr:hypothetical protein DEJ48_35950 [Streptomyces venezuelae]